MPWIYLSPHLDDAAFSCGGLIWQQATDGDTVEVWTVFAGDPPPGDFSRFARSLHRRWGLDREAAIYRRAEDRAACSELGVNFQQFEYPDGAYRRHPKRDKPLYRSARAIFGSLRSADKPLIDEIAGVLAERLPRQVNLVCPLAVGNHVDHQITRHAAENLGRPLHYYAEVPYVLDNPTALEPLLAPDFQPETFLISEAALRAWGNAAAAYTSQISTFWEGEDAMRAAIKAYQAQYDGLRLWSRPSPAST